MNKFHAQINAYALTKTVNYLLDHGYRFQNTSEIHNTLLINSDLYSLCRYFFHQYYEEKETFD